MMISGANIALLTALLIVQLVHVQSLSSVNYGSKGFNFPDDPQPQPQDPNDFVDQQMPEDGLLRQATFPILPSTVAGFPGLLTPIPTLPAFNNLSNVFLTPQILTGPTTTGQTCTCVPTGACNLTTVPGSVDGTGSIDIRIVTNPSTVITPPNIVGSPSSCQAGLVLCCRPGGYQCGIRYPPVAGSPTPGVGQAPYGAYPWQAALLGPGDVYVASGALINPTNVLTVAHRVTQFVAVPTTLKVRLGEWNAGGATEPIQAQDFIVSRVITHPSYNANNLKNDVAILRLSTAVVLGTTPTVTTACLPATPFTGSRCWVSGWGRNDFNSGSFQAIQKQVDVPVLANTACQSQLAATRLGPTFVFDTVSFLCAGGEAGKDACTGDGGSPLVCSLGDRWFVAGLVAWGIGCGVSNVPGVYVNIQSFIPWIQTAVLS